MQLLPAHKDILMSNIYLLNTSDDFGDFYIKEIADILNAKEIIKISSSKIEELYKLYQKHSKNIEDLREKVVRVLAGSRDSDALIVVQHTISQNK